VPPVTPPVTVGANQVYEVPTGMAFGADEIGNTLKGLELHISEVISTKNGTGSTLIVTVKVDVH
jgi:hypothetical protein